MLLVLADSHSLLSNPPMLRDEEDEVDANSDSGEDTSFLNQEDV